MAIGNGWKLSRYTYLIDCNNGDLLLHNSFMGAIARIPADKSAELKRLIESPPNGALKDNEALEELYQQGFLVDANLDEQKFVTGILEKERNKVRMDLIILPHENCNFRCVYCYQDFERGKMPRGIIEGLKAFVNQNIEKYKALNVSWFGGEPLLAVDIILELNDFFIERCERDSIGFSSTMTTNGYLLTPDVADKLIRRRVKSFQVTLDGPARVHNMNRRLAGGGETYQKIVNNLIALKNRSDDFSVRIRVNLDNSSIPLIERWLVDELAPLFAHDSRFALSFDIVRKWGGANDDTLDVCTPELALPLRLEFTHKALRLGFSDKVVKESLMPHGNVCYAGKESSLSIGSDGTVYKCTIALNDPRNQVGKLQPDGQLILDPELLKLWTNWDGQNNAWCHDCPFYPSCQSRKCPLTAINQNGPPCPMTRQMYETSVKLVAFGREPVLP